MAAIAIAIAIGIDTALPTEVIPISIAIAIPIAIPIATAKPDLYGKNRAHQRPALRLRAEVSSTSDVPAQPTL